MFNTVEQFAAAARNQKEVQLSLATSFSDSMIEGVEKLMGLNLQAAKAGLESSLANAQQLMSAKDPQELFSTASQQAQPQAEIVLTYARHLATIATNQQKEFASVVETQVSESSRQLVSMLDDMTKLAPAGSETAISMMKSAIDNASSGFSQLSRSAKVAVETMESNLDTAVAQMSQASPKAARTKKQAAH